MLITIQDIYPIHVFHNISDTRWLLILMFFFWWPFKKWPYKKKKKTQLPQNTKEFFLLDVKQ